MAAAAMEMKEAAHRGILDGEERVWVGWEAWLYQWHPYLVAAILWRVGVPQCMVATLLQAVAAPRRMVAAPL